MLAEVIVSQTPIQILTKAPMKNRENISPDSTSRGVLTLAFGKPRFIEQAKALGRSMQLHASRIETAIVTDSKDPELRELFTQVIAYRPEFGSSVRQKLHLNLYTPFDETLFVDSDCLVLGNLDRFWTAFAGQAFGVPGYEFLRRGEADPYLDVDFALDHFGVDGLPKFNGGTYYFDNSDKADHFFATTRELLANWKDLHFAEFRRDGPADEPIVSVAMAIHDLGPTSMGAGGMYTPTAYTGPLHLDVLKGTCSFKKKGRMVSPEIVHFAGEYAFCYAYPREAARLKRYFGGKASSLLLAKAYVTSFLWQCTRRSPGLATVARRWMRLYRSGASPLSRLSTVA
jgi:hypothetical protein